MEIAARFMLDLVRPGAADILIAKAKTTEIKMCMLSAFDDYRMTVVPESSPVWSAVSVRFPDERVLFWRASSV